MLYNVLVVSLPSIVLITAALELHETVKQVKPDDYVIQHYVRMIQRASCASMETDHLNLLSNMVSVTNIPIQSVT